MTIKDLKIDIQYRLDDLRYYGRDKDCCVYKEIKLLEWFLERLDDLIGGGDRTLAPVTPKYSGRWHGREVEGLPMGHGANL